MAKVKLAVYNRYFHDEEQTIRKNITWVQEHLDKLDRKKYADKLCEQLRNCRIITRRLEILLIECRGEENLIDLNEEQYIREIIASTFSAIRELSDELHDIAKKYGD